MLTQLEIDELINMLKTLVSKDIVNFPKPTEYMKLDLESLDGKTKFIIDINRKGSIKLEKCTFQTRYQTSIELLRIDLDGPDHTNPNGESIPCPHIHIYREGFKVKWAYPLSDFLVTDTKNLIQVFIDFLEYNKINDIPQVRYQDTLF